MRARSSFPFSTFPLTPSSIWMPLERAKIAVHELRKAPRNPKGFSERTGTTMEYLGREGQSNLLKGASRPEASHFETTPTRLQGLPDGGALAMARQTLLRQLIRAT